MNKSENLPKIELDDEDFGCVLNCAVRYSIGRMTYMPKLVMDFIRPLLPYISVRALWCLERDIKNADDYGDPLIDEPGWKNFLAEIQNEIQTREKEGKQ